MSKQAPSTRATAHSQFSVGLVNIPVSIFSGIDSKSGVTRKQFIPVPVIDPATGKQKIEVVTKEDGTTEEVPIFEDHPVGSQPYDKDTGETVAHSEVQRKIETEYGYVYVDDHEIEQLFDLVPKSIIVKAFQPQHLFFQGNYVPRSIGYVEASKIPGKGGKKVDNVAGQKAFAMVLKAMREEGAMALVEVTDRGVPKPAVLMPDGSLWYLYHTDDLREQRPLPEIEVEAPVVAQARVLIKTLWDDTVQDLTDERAALIQAFADEKARAGDFGRSVEAEEPQVPQSDSSDLMAMLAASVEVAKQQQAEAG
jgi:non-homologous end joining protein Ku